MRAVLIFLWMASIVNPDPAEVGRQVALTGGLWASACAALHPAARVEAQVRPGIKFGHPSATLVGHCVLREATETGGADIGPGRAGRLTAPAPARPPPTAATPPKRQPERKERVMRIKQEKTEAPVALKGAALEKLEHLLRRAGRAAAQKQELAAQMAPRLEALKADEETIKLDFEALRAQLERANGLRKTYTVDNGAGAIQVSLGRIFQLKEKFRANPAALQNKLAEPGMESLGGCFKTSVVPDQKAVQQNLCKELLQLGGMADKAPTITLKGPVKG